MDLIYSGRRFSIAIFGRSLHLVIWLFVCIIASFIFCQNAGAQVIHHLQIHVIDLDSKPLSKIQFTAELKDASTSGLSDSQGMATLGIGADIKSGTPITLEVSSAQNEYIFISPEDQRVRIPPFEQTSSIIEVVLAKSGDRRVLQTPSGIYSILVKLIDGESLPSVAASGRKQNAMAEVAQKYKLSQVEIESAITLWRLNNPSNPSVAGLAALYKDKNEDAIGLFKAAVIEKNKQSADLSYYLGIAYMKSNDYKAAVKAFETALRVDPTNSSYLELTGDSYAKISQYAKADQMYKDALKALDDPSDSVNYSYILRDHAKMLEHLHRYSEAEAAFKEDYETAMKNYEGPDYIVVEGSVASYASFLESRGKYEHSAKLYRDIFIGLDSGEAADSSHAYIPPIVRVLLKNKASSSDEDIVKFILGDLANNVGDKELQSIVKDVKEARISLSRKSTASIRHSQ